MSDKIVVVCEVSTEIDFCALVFLNYSSLEMSVVVLILSETPKAMKSAPNTYVD